MKNHKSTCLPLLSLIGISLLFTMFVVGNSFAYYTTSSSYFPSVASVDSIYVINSAFLTDPTEVMVQTLMGVVAKTKPQIYITYDNLYNDYLTDMVNRAGVTYTNIGSPWTLVNMFKSYLTSNRFILYIQNTPSENVATSLCGPFKAIAIETSLYDQATANGLSLYLDVRGHDEQWCFSNYSTFFNKKIAFGQVEENIQLRDYVVLCDGFIMDSHTYATLTNDTSVFNNRVLSWLEDDVPLMGWTRGDEYQYVGSAAQRSKVVVASLSCMNLSLLAGVHFPTLNEFRVPYHRTLRDITWEDNVHYASYLLTDGDNLGIIMWNAFATNISYNADRENFWGSTLRGTFAFGWEMPPVSAFDMAPMSLRYLYKTATPKDGLVMMETYYPDIYGQFSVSTDLQIHCQRINPIMRKSGYNTINVITPSWSNATTWGATYSQNIDRLLGLTYVQYSPTYAAGGGAVQWVKDTGGYDIPIISTQYAQWLNLNSYGMATSPYGIATSINALAHTGQPTTKDYYSLVAVHYWSDWDGNPGANPPYYRGLPPTRDSVTTLNSYVRVVTPEELLLQFRLRAKPDQTLNLYLGRFYKKISQLQGMLAPNNAAYQQLTTAIYDYTQAVNFYSLNNWQASFTTAQRADMDTEKARLSFTSVTSIGGFIVLNTPKPASPVFHYDITEVDTTVLPVQAYQIQFANNLSFASPSIDTTISASIFQIPNGADPYYRVRAIGRIYNDMGVWITNVDHAVVIPGPWSPLDSLDNCTATGLLGWNYGTGTVFQESVIKQEGTGSMRLPGKNGASPQFQRDWSPFINIGPSSNWLQYWIKPNNSGDILACYFLDTTGSFNDFRQHLLFNEWRPVVVNLNYFTGRIGSPGPQIDYTHMFGMAFQYFGNGLSSYTTYLDDIEILTQPSQPQEIDYMDQGFFLFNSSNYSLLTVYYDTGPNKSSGQRSLHLTRLSVGAPAYVSETFNDTSFGFATIRNMTPSHFQNVEMDIWGDNSGAVLRMAFIVFNDISKAFYSDVTINFSGLQHIMLPLNSFTASGGAISTDWERLGFFQIQDNNGSILFNINIDSVVATPIVITSIRDWELY